MSDHDNILSDNFVTLGNSGDMFFKADSPPRRAVAAIAAVTSTSNLTLHAIQQQLKTLTDRVNTLERKVEMYEVVQSEEIEGESAANTLADEAAVAVLEKKISFHEVVAFVRYFNDTVGLPLVCDVPKADGWYYVQPCVIAFVLSMYEPFKCTKKDIEKILKTSVPDEKIKAYKKACPFILPLRSSRTEAYIIEPEFWRNVYDECDPQRVLKSKLEESPASAAEAAAATVAEAAATDENDNDKSVRESTLGGVSEGRGVGRPSQPWNLPGFDNFDRKRPIPVVLFPEYQYTDNEHPDYDLLDVETYLLRYDCRNEREAQLIRDGDIGTFARECSETDGDPPTAPKFCMFYYNNELIRDVDFEKNQLQMHVPQFKFEEEEEEEEGEDEIDSEEYLPSSSSSSAVQKKKKKRGRPPSKKKAAAAATADSGDDFSAKKRAKKF